MSALLRCTFWSNISILQRSLWSFFWSSQRNVVLPRRLTPYFHLFCLSPNPIFLFPPSSLFPPSLLPPNLSFRFRKIRLLGNTGPIFGPFLDAPSHLYKRSCPSVRRSVRPSVRPSPVLFKHVLGASCAVYPALFISYPLLIFNFATASVTVTESKSGLSKNLFYLYILNAKS